MSHRFVLPPLDGPITGGTVYNRELIEALERQGHRCTVHPTPHTGAADTAPLQWVDSLFLEAFSTWSTQAPLGLLAHYLPSLVRHGDRLQSSDLTTAERCSLEHARAIVTPSPYLRDVLVRLGVSPERVGCVEPGVHAAAGPGTHSGSSPQLVLVANLTPGKGVVPLLHALGAGGRSLAASLRIVGSTTMDPAYATLCRKAAAPLGDAVQFLGALPRHTCLEHIACANLLVSASRMESYGIAIAEARACGVPVTALRGGNVEHLVQAEAGGRVVSTMAELADTVHSDLANPRQQDRRRASALRHRVHRTWASAAQEWVEVAERLATP